MNANESGAKICCRCLTSKPIADFKERKPGVLNGACTQCVRLGKARYKKTEKGRASDRRYKSSVNPEKRRDIERARRSKPAVRAKRNADQRLIKSTEASKQKRREYLARPDVKARVLELRRNRYRERYASEVVKIDYRLRTLIRRSLATGKNNRSWRSMVNFTVEELKAHLERQFVGGMNWEEFNAGNIHIDHIVPIASFDIREPGDAEFMACWNIANLRPMWARDNQKKRDRIEFII